MPKTRELLLGGGEHTELVLTVLGLLSVGERLDALLAPRNEGEALAGDEPVVLAALGLVSLRRSLGRWIESAAADEAPDVPPPAPLPPPPGLSR